MKPSLLTLHSADGLWTNLRLAPDATALGSDAMPDAAIFIENGHIAFVGHHDQLPPIKSRITRHDGGNALVTPGLIDCHTHLVYGGQRAHEFAMRLNGATYQEVAQAGGGIVSSVKATRAASEDELFAMAAKRLVSLLREGVCAIEIKSGYGLRLDDERKQLRVARRLAQAYGVTVKTTFLAAHALPPEFAGRSQDYINVVCQTMMPTLASEGLIDAVDVFCETIGFSLDETTQVFKAAKRLGLPVKLHAEQLSDMGGSALAASFGALSCDHIEHLSEQGIAAMQASGTVGVLLPGAYYFLRETHLPPIAALRQAGVPMAVATDHNPGTSPTLSLLLMLNMASTLFRLTVSEAIAGVTHHAAQALGLQQTHGRIAVGMPANFVLWPLNDASELVYWIGQSPHCRVVRQGRIIKDTEAA
ncbi:MAG: imidazolonepropionase [Alcaligenes aquatilis]